VALHARAAHVFAILAPAVTNPDRGAQTQIWAPFPIQDSMTPQSPSSSNDVANALESLDERVSRVLIDGRAQFKKFVARRVKDDSIAEDILQESLMRAIQKSGDLRESENIVAWFHQILRNAVIDYFRTRTTDQNKTAAFQRELTAQGDRAVSAPDEPRSEACRCLAFLLPALKPDYATLLDRIDLKEEPAAQVAQDLSITPGNLKVKLHRARQALKVSLERCCGSCATHGCVDCDCA